MKSLEESPEISSIIWWIYSNAKRNLWRVGSWYDLEDLINDGLLIALKCRQKLGTEVDDKHYNSYVRKAFHNHLGELIRRKRGVNEVSFLDVVGRSDCDLTEQESEELILPPQPCSQEIVAALCQMPESLKRVIDLMVSEEGRKKLDEPMRQRVDGEETMTDRLYRLAGWRRDLDFEEELTEYLLCG